MMISTSQSISTSPMKTFYKPSAFHSSIMHYLGLEGVFCLRRLGISYTLRGMVFDVLVGIVFNVLVGIVFHVLVGIVFGVLVGLVFNVLVGIVFNVLVGMVF